jgi:hypothetical protein
MATNSSEPEVFRLFSNVFSANDRNAEQNGCRQRLEGYLSCQQRLALAVA